jgi:hypothetical protein
MTKRRSETTIAPVEFIDRVIKHDEKGEPFSLAPPPVARRPKL